MRISCGFLLYCTILVFFLFSACRLACTMPSLHVCLLCPTSPYMPVFHPTPCLHSAALICTINWPHFSDPKWRIRCQKSCKRNILPRFHAPKSKGEIFVDGYTERRCLSFDEVLRSIGSITSLIFAPRICTSSLLLPLGAGWLAPATPQA